MILLYRLLSPDAISSSTESLSTDKVKSVFEAFPSVAGFFLTALSASTLSQVASGTLVENNSLYYGASILVMICVGILLCKRSGVPNWKLSFPLALIIYGFAIAASLFVGRTDQISDNYNWASSIWYSPHWKMFALGLLSLAILPVASKSNKFKIGNYIYCAIVLATLASTTIYSSYIEYKNTPNIIAYWDRMRMDALNPSSLQMANEDKLTSFALSKRDTINMLEILQEYKLSVYRGNPKFISTADFTYIDNTKLILGAGFYSDRWLGPEANAHIEIKNPNSIVTMRLVPAPTIPSINCDFFLGGKKSYTRTFLANEPRLIAIEADQLVRAYETSWLSIKVVCDSYFMPTNGDTRPLSLHAREISEHPPS
jgi:hypothetical protein